MKPPLGRISSGNMCACAAMQVAGGEGVEHVAGMCNWFERASDGEHGAILSMDANSPPQHPATDNCWKVRT